MAGRRMAVNLLDGHGPWLIFAVALGVSVLLYASALSGPPISDDFLFLLNPWIQTPSTDALIALFDPWSQATTSLKNYAPLRGVLLMFQWWAHPQNALAYHLTNLAVHAGATTLLAIFFASVGVPVVTALLAAALFLVHPANVEALAWMSQLWSPFALFFSLAALLLLPRRPLQATLLLAIALLSKPMAVFAAPTALVLAFCNRDAGARTTPADRRRWGWLGLWLLLTLLFSLAQLTAYGDTGPRPLLHEDTGVALRTICTYALRYLVMAATSLGVSAFQEPPFASSWTDPVWLISAVVLAGLAVRLVVTLRRQSVEAAGWVWALASFAPISQIFPFLYPMADRYLYFLLPGLLLAACFVARDLQQRVGDPVRRVFLQRAFAAVALVGIALFSLRTFERAKLWRSEDAVMADAARAWPDGVPALLFRARGAAQQGDAPTAIALLQAAAARDWDYWNTLRTHPAFEPIRTDPRFVALLREFAGHFIERIERTEHPTQLDLLQIVDAHALRGETDAALDAADRGLALGGPLDEPLRARRAQVARQAAPR